MMRLTDDIGAALAANLYERLKGQRLGSPCGENKGNFFKRRKIEMRCDCISNQKGKSAATRMRAGA